MRLIRSLTLLLSLLALQLSSVARADDLYQVEMILIRQNAVPSFNTQPAPENWAAGAPRLSAQDERRTSLDDIANKLAASPDYSVLLHKAWQQALGSEPTTIAISSGQEQFGQHPIEGTLGLALGRFTDVDAQFWVNQFDSNGMIVASERLKQSSRTKNGELNFIDNGHLALLLKVTPLNAPPKTAAPLGLPD